jgi:alpha-glucoside transport system permease protein
MVGLLVLGLALTLESFRRVFLYLRDDAAPFWVVFPMALVWGIGGTFLIVWLLNAIVERLGARLERRLLPWVFVGPMLIMISYYLLLPALRTVYLSFFDARSERFVGLDNFSFAFANSIMQEAFRNNLLWFMFGGGSSVLLGLVIAALADRTHPVFETFVKTMLFLPLVMSAVTAAVIWRLVYAYVPAGSEQIGLLNAVVTALGASPVAWLLQRPWNTFFLIAMLVWAQTGFTTTVFSAAIKGVPKDLLEAALIDGATWWQGFVRVTVPNIRGTILAICTSVLIVTLNIFETVYAMTGGNYGTQVIAGEQFTQMFSNFDTGRGAAIGVVLLVLVTPVVIYNILAYQKDQA